MLVLASILASCNTKQQSEGSTAPAADTAAVAKTPAEPGDRGYIVAVGDTAPDFTLNLDNGSSFTLSQHRGQVVMLQFTASWCGICRKEMPHIESDIWQRFGSNSDFVLIGIDREETPEKVAMLKEKTGVTYPIAYDTDGSAFRLYAHPEAGITRNILVDRDGRIAMLTRRFEQQEFDSLCSKIAHLIEK